MSRISEERMSNALEQLKTISDADYAKIKGIVDVVRPFWRAVEHIRCRGN